MPPIHARPKGIVALVTVLMVMAVLLSIGLAISAIGRNEIVLSGVVEYGETAFSIADACTEEGLVRFKMDAGYTGSAFELDGGTCRVTVTNLGGNDRLIRGQGEYRDAIRIIEANVTLTVNAQGNAKKVTINSWKEAD
jgi:hypothetical protein